MERERLRESFEKYVSLFEQRQSAFIASGDYTEFQFLCSEIEAFQNTLFDLERIADSFDGNSIMGMANFTFSLEVMKEQGWTHFFNSTKGKIEFLDNLIIALGEASRTDKDYQEENSSFLASVIDYSLFEFKEKIQTKSYQQLIDSLSYYFQHTKFPDNSKKILVTRIDKRSFAQALNIIHIKAWNRTVTIEYLKFAKNYISIFADVHFDENAIQNSELYKYFTT